MPERRWQELRALIGLERNTTSHTEKLISVAGAFAGMLAVFVICNTLFDNTTDNLLILGSIGASAVLLFAAPQGALSQPWPVIGGHIVSAFVGVSCYQAVGDSIVSAPVLINVLAIVTIAVLFNSLFHWRRYPSHLAKRHKRSQEIQGNEREYELTQEDFAAAMQQLDSYIDITSDALTELLELAKIHAGKNITHPHEIEPGHFYSNGKLGKLWSIRQIINHADATSPNNAHPGKDTVIYRVVAGNGASDTAVCTRSEFRHWARFEVVMDNGRWVKVMTPGKMSS